ncbi:MAG: hypothetical protein AAFZ09_03410, partial [Pseudomonadota bacterium]
IKEGMPAEMFRDDAKRIAARMEVLKAELDGAEEPTPILHPATAKMYAEEVRRNHPIGAACHAVRRGLMLRRY